MPYLIFFGIPYLLFQSRLDHSLIPVILSIAEVMKMDVVAEGIETQEQLKQLRDLGCEFGQGFLFAKPLDAHTATQLILQNTQWY